MVVDGDEDNGWCGWWLRVLRCYVRKKNRDVVVTSGGWCLWVGDGGFVMISWGVCDGLVVMSWWFGGSMVVVLLCWFDVCWIMIDSYGV
nr:hypothetical protein [Tanacetum cinerariifolium]